MATPTTEIAHSEVSASGNRQIDGLLWGTKWGGLAHTPATITYSFPGIPSYWTSDYATGFAAPEPYPLDPLFTPLDSSQRAIFVSALQQWANVANITFVLSVDDSTTVGTIRVAYEFNASPNIAAHAYFPGYSPQGDWQTDSPSGGDVWLNINSPPMLNLAPGAFGYHALIHELGHALGLKHPHDFVPSGFEPFSFLGLSALDHTLYTVMSYNRSYQIAGTTVTIKPMTPMPLDIRAIQYLYGANMTYHTGDDDYILSDDGLTKTIWDAGGNDTLDAGGADFPVQIDIRPFAYSVQSGVFGYSFHTRTHLPSITAIASGVSIENATGGSAGDTITGNEGANRLIGNGGNDSIYGNGGLDSIYGGDGDDVLDGGAGNDLILPGPGNDGVSGGAGIDTVKFSGGRSDYVISVTGSSVIVSDLAPFRDGADTLVSVEFVKFDADGAVLISGLTVTGGSVVEGNSGTTNLPFTLRLPLAAPYQITIDYATVDGSATSAGDYIAKSGTITFSPGDIKKVVQVAIVGDLLHELNETVGLILSNPVGVILPAATVFGTIVNDDPPPALSINDVAASEGENALFAVTLSKPSGAQITVNFVTANGTAPAPSDYASASGTLTFAPGLTSQTVTVGTVNDNIYESNESFFVNLSGASNATIADSQGIATIIDNDPLPALSISDVTVAEGGTATFAVTLSNPSAFTAVADFATANGTATSSDYFSNFGVTTFAPGETSQIVTVLTRTDGTFEGSESFFLNLSNASGAIIADSQGQAAIADGQTIPAISIDDVTIAEGGTPVFTLTLSNPSAFTVTVNYATLDATATATTPDYIEVGGIATFAPGVTSQIVAVNTLIDNITETTESFFINLSDVVGATIADSQGIGAIVDDDPLPEISIANVTVSEGDTALFTLTLSNPSASTVTVQYQTAEGTVSELEDFTGKSGVLTFLPGATAGTITVSTVEDFLVESDETFFVDLSVPTNATVVNGHGIGTIRNDDINSPPNATFDVYTTLKEQSIDSAALASVLINDSDPNADPLTVSLIAGPSHGALALNSDGSFKYVPTSGFIGADSFTYQVSDGHGGTDTEGVKLSVVPVLQGTTTTLDLVALSPAQQIAGVYVAFFGRGADFEGFNFWLGEFDRGLANGKPTKQLLADIASSFGVSDEAKALYPFLQDPQHATPAQIDDFINSVYLNLFNRGPDSEGLDNWIGQINQTLASDKFVGNVLVDIMGGAQNSPAGNDITTLMNKVEVGIYYAQTIGTLGDVWTLADDKADATSLIQGITNDPISVLNGIAEANRLILADLQDTVGLIGVAGDVAPEILF